MESDWSDASSFATERSFDVDDFSPPPSPEVEEGDLSGHRARALSIRATGSNCELLTPNADDASEATPDSF